MNFIPIPRIFPSLRWGFVWILFLLFSLTACQNGEMVLTRFEDSPVIDSLLESAHHFVVNTDIKPERWIATTRLGTPTDSLFIGRPANMISVGDSVYISELYGHNIFVMGDDGYLSRKIGARGKAPGEFNHIWGIDYDGSHIFVKDSERIQIFTEKFEYVGSFPNFMTGFQQRFSVSPDYIFLECIGIDWLICPYSKSPPYSWIESARLLPVLEVDGRSGENGNIVTVSPEGDRIAVAYIGLPYIFVYDDQFRHLKTIRFEGKQVRDFEPAVGHPDGSLAGIEPGTRGFIITMKFLNSRYLMVNPEDNYVLDLSENDYKIAANMIFTTFDDTEKINAEDFLLHGDHLYVSSPWKEYIYGYEFDLE